MEHQLFINGLKILSNSDRPGFSFVKDFSEWTYENRDSFNVSHTINYWVLENENNRQDFYYYGGGVEMIRQGLDLLGMLSNNQIIDTSDKQFSAFSGKDFWSDSHILSFPIKEVKTPYFNLKGILVLVAKKGTINISKDQIEILGTLFANRKPNGFGYKSAIESIGKLENDISSSYNIIQTNPEYNQLFNAIISAIDSLAESRNSETPGLKHYSQWEILTTKKKPAHLLKIFRHNTVSIDPMGDTNTHICENDCHFLNDILKELDSSIADCSLSFQSQTDVYTSLRNHEYFAKIGLPKNCNGTIISFAKRLSFGRINGYVSNFYIKDLPFTIFICPEIIVRISNLVFSAILNVGRLQNLKLLYAIALDFQDYYRNHLDFFDEVSKLLAEWNGAEKCLIYQNIEGQLQNMNRMEYSNCKIKIINGLPIPSILVDENFEHFLNKISLTSKSQILEEDYNFHFSPDGEIVKNAMVMTTYHQEGLPKSILIFINKKNTLSFDGTYFNNEFSFFNSLQTSLSGLFIYHYNLLMQSLDRKSYILKKFRHEIPSCTDAINASIEEIQNSFSRKKPLSTPNTLNILNMMKLNNSRVSLLANFFSTSDFADSRFAESKAETSFRSFMNSYIDIFRTEGLYKGVDIYFECKDCENNPIADITLTVSNYFMLSIVNVVTNAIRYSAPGTCVNVFAYPDRVEVIDIGIPVREEEKCMIFEEGYRGKDARMINEKGMGYGLYLTKRIIEAHGNHIEVESDYEYDQNYYLEKVIYQYYQSLSSEEKHGFLYNGAEQSEYTLINNLLNQIKYADSLPINKTYINYKQDVVKKWIAYQMEHKASFIDFQEIFFEQQIYKVKFTISISQ